MPNSRTNRRNTLDEPQSHPNPFVEGTDEWMEQVIIFELGYWKEVVIGIRSSSALRWCRQAYTDLIGTANFMKHVAFCYIDECHVVVPWSQTFRPLYAKISLYGIGWRAI